MQAKVVKLVPVTPKLTPAQANFLLGVLDQRVTTQGVQESSLLLGCFQAINNALDEAARQADELAAQAQAEAAAEEPKPEEPVPAPASPPKPSPAKKVANKRRRTTKKKR